MEHTLREQGAYNDYPSDVTQLYAMQFLEDILQMKSHKFLTPFIFLIILLSLIGSHAQKNASNPIPITLQLKWIHQAQFAGYYAAKEKGFYTEENIAITILPGGPGIDYFDVLETGQADFAVVRREGFHENGLKAIKSQQLRQSTGAIPILMVSKAEFGYIDLPTIYRVILLRLEAQVQGYPIFGTVK